MKQKPLLYMGALLALLIICNLAFVYSEGWSRWIWQLVGFGGLFGVYKLAGLGLTDIGLSREQLGSGFKYGIVAIGLISVVFVSIFLIDRNVFTDKRYDQSLHTAIISALFFLPLQTVLFEEIAFRGIMPAILKKFNPAYWFALVISSLLFGLWHILSAPHGSLAGVVTQSNLLIVAAVFIATATAGAILYILRYKSGSLVAPIMVHWFVNGLAITLAALAWSKN
jgi:membrane protease YdiL (CAAX protease family)